MLPSPATEGGESESLGLWAATQSIARLSAIWYSRARANL
jgi:hypothetical protein